MFTGSTAMIQGHRCTRGDRNHLWLDGGIVSFPGTVYVQLD